jgi:NADH-quinone oxidoreductase subunit D
MAVRLLELFETYRGIRLILDALPPGELAVRMPRRVPAGETISRVEAPRGELLYFVKSEGTDRPARVKVRTPSLLNIAAAVHQMVGGPLADVPMILAGVDPCFSCNDRLVVIDGPRRDRRLLRWEDLRRYGIAFHQGRREPL